MPDPVRDSALQNIAQQLGRLAAQGGLATTYATGTWLPVLNFGGSVPTISYSTQAGTWTQIGREFFCNFRIILATLASASGAVTITGLPATVSSDSAAVGLGGMLTNYSLFSTITSIPVIHAVTASTSVQLRMFASPNMIAVDAANFTNTSTNLVGWFRFYI